MKYNLNGYAHIYKILIRPINFGFIRGVDVLKLYHIIRITSSCCIRLYVNKNALFILIVYVY